MGTRKLTLELPDELVSLLGSPEAAVTKAKEALVLQLLRRVEISQGQAARFLGLTRWDILQLMAKHEIPAGPVTAEEVDRETEVIQRYIRKSGRRAGGQQ
jgi:hypothetical protein